MPSLALKYDVRRAVRAGIVALGLVTLAIPIAIVSSPDAFASEDDKVGESGRGAAPTSGATGASLKALSSFASGTTNTSLRAGASSRNGSASAAGAGVAAASGAGGAANGGSTTGSAPSNDGAAGNGSLNGRAGISASEGSDVAAAFESLTRPQQARVMQRCRDVVAKPAQAETKQLAICQTLMTMAKQ